MFFDAKYILESSRACERFGICDTPRGAYSTDECEETWEAVVVNKEFREVQFVPVDHNMEFRDANGDLLSTCDGMLFTKDNRYLIFVEIKDIRKGWMSEPKLQLASTIQLFRDEVPTDDYEMHLAYVANRNHPNFQFSRKQEMQEFYNIYKFRLIYLYEISL